MQTLSYSELPMTNDPRQVFTVDVTIDGAAFHARIEIRYLSAPDLWVISIWDNAPSELLVNQVPLVCSYAEPNNLLLPSGVCGAVPGQIGHKKTGSHKGGETAGKRRWHPKIPVALYVCYQNSQAYTSHFLTWKCAFFAQLSDLYITI